MILKLNKEKNIKNSFVKQNISINLQTFKNKNDNYSKEYHLFVASVIRLIIDSRLLN